MPPPSIRHRYTALGTWGFRSYGEPSARPRLLCFPPVGGHSLSFRGLAAALAPEIQVIAVDPPGHGFLESPALESVTEMVHAYWAGLPAELTDGAVYFGYSLGAYVAHQLALETGAHRLILGAPVPYARRRERLYSELSSPELSQALSELGGLPPAIRAAPELYARFEPVLRADFHAFETCEAPRRTAIPTLILGGEQDPLCPPAYLEEWAAHTEVVQIERFAGGHFFLDSALPEVARCLRAWLC